MKEFEYSFSEKNDIYNFNKNGNLETSNKKSQTKILACSKNKSFKKRYVYIQSAFDVIIIPYFKNFR